MVVLTSSWQITPLTCWTKRAKIFDMVNIVYPKWQSTNILFKGFQKTHEMAEAINLLRNVRSKQHPIKFVAFLDGEIPFWLCLNEIRNTATKKLGRKGLAACRFWTASSSPYNGLHCASWNTTELQPTKPVVRNSKAFRAKISKRTLGVKRSHQSTSF